MKNALFLLILITSLIVLMGCVVVDGKLNFCENLSDESKKEYILENLGGPIQVDNNVYSNIDKNSFSGAKNWFHTEKVENSSIYLFAPDNWKNFASSMENPIKIVFDNSDKVIAINCGTPNWKVYKN